MTEKPRTTETNRFRLRSFLLTTALCVALAALGLVWVLFSTPAEMQPQEREGELSLLSYAEAQEETEEEAEPEETEPGVRLLDIDENRIKGKLILVSDPTRVILGSTDPLGFVPGMQLPELVERYDGMAGINAGGYADDNGLSNGSTPVGLVIRDGVICWGAAGGRYHVVGLTEDGRLLVGEMSGQEALDAGITWAVSFLTYDGYKSELIVNGQVRKENLGPGVNPRTAIGQREDGTLLLLVLDGRSFETLGASLEDVCSVMLEYGAVTAGNLDGGASSVMVYEGEIVNHCSSVMEARSIPTAFIVKREG